MDNIQEYTAPPTANKNIPIELLIEYSNKNLSYSQIAKLAGCSKSNVIHRFQAIDYTPPRLQAFKENRADVFAWYQTKFLKSITDEDIQKAPMHSKVLAAGILYDKERLERGQATSISGFEGQGDDGLMAKIQGLMERASRIGIKLTEIVGEIPQDLRAKVLPDACLSLAESDNNGVSGK